MPDDHADINHQIGAMEAGVEYMKDQIDKLVAKIDKQQSDIDEIKLTIAEFRGAKKLTDWLRSIIAGIIGAIAAGASIIGIFWGKP